MNKAWSYSSMKQYITCPKQYYHLRVAKDYEDKQSNEVTAYGTAFHLAAEEYVRDNKELPPAFCFAKQYLDALKGLRGDKYCEYKMGLTADLVPCEFFAPDIWLRGIADLLIINGDKAYVLDYKTGKSAKYADTSQLELLALMVFKHFPEVTYVKAGLLFVIANTYVDAKYYRKNESTTWATWLAKYATLAAAHRNNRWNPRPSGLCKRHCIIEECPHCGG